MRKISVIIGLFSLPLVIHAQYVQCKTISIFQSVGIGSMQPKPIFVTIEMVVACIILLVTLFLIHKIIYSRHISQIAQQMQGVMRHSFMIFVITASTVLIIYSWLVVFYIAESIFGDYLRYYYSISWQVWLSNLTYADNAYVHFLFYVLMSPFVFVIKNGFLASFSVVLVMFFISYYIFTHRVTSWKRFRVVAFLLGMLLLGVFSVLFISSIFPEIGWSYKECGFLPDA